MRLGDLVEGLAGLRLHGPGEAAVRGITLDSRRVAPGQLFAALRGRATDGRRFVPQAVAAGAVAVLSAPPRPDGCRDDTPWIEARRPREALAALCRAFHRAPDEALSVVGVTGTDGKTTTTRMVAAALRNAGRRVATVGTLGATLPEAEIPTSLTTPEAPDLWPLLAAARDAGVDVAAIEVSSVALDAERTAGLRFEGAVLTGLGHDHLDLHGSLESYWGAKRRLFEGLEESAFAVLPSDVPAASSFARATRARTRSFGEDPGATWRVVDHAPRRHGARFRLIGPAFDERIDTPRSGPWDARNIAAATAAAVELGAPAREAAEGAAALGNLAGRFELIDEGQSFVAIVDYAHTPEALERVMGLLRSLAPGRVVVVFGCGGGRDAEKRRPMGAIAGRLADIVVVTDDNPRDEDPEEIAAHVIDGVRQAGRDAVRIADRREAIAHAVTLARPNDAVLVAGKGHETTQEVRGVRTPLDDRECVREALRSGRRA